MKFRHKLMIAAVTVGAAVLVVCILRWRDSLPRLTPESFQAAMRQWKEQGPDDYDMDLEIRGNRPGVVHIEVRGGVATAMTRDGFSPDQRRTWDYWTVPGQFDTMQIELESQSDPRGQFAGVRGDQLILWAEFDPQYGFPRRYRRVLLDTQQDLEWTVTRFTPR